MPLGIQNLGIKENPFSFVLSQRSTYMNHISWKFKTIFFLNLYIRQAHRHVMTIFPKPTKNVIYLELVKILTAKSYLSNIFPQNHKNSHHLFWRTKLRKYLRFEFEPVSYRTIQNQPLMFVKSTPPQICQSHDNTNFQ